MRKKDLQHNWSKMAAAYESYTSAPTSYGNTIEIPAVKKLLPELHGKSILDLGCGSGRFSFLFEEFQPKSILGIDFSEEMINIARELGSQRKSNVEFIQGDIEDLSSIAAESIDFVFSSTVLHFIQNIDGVLKEIHRVLKPKGDCIFTVIHPVYSAQYPIAKDAGSFPEESDWKIRYLNKAMRAYVQPWIQYNPEIENFLTYSYHHTMGDYINSIIGAGLRLKSLTEPCPPIEWATEKPKRYHGFLDIPTYAVFHIEK